MKHKCTNCKKIYEDGADEILIGCICGCRTFFFLSGKQKGKKKKTGDNTSDNTSIEYEYETDEEDNVQISLDTESINILCEGKYELDIEHLMNNQSSVVYKYGDGKYSINLDLKKKK